MESNLNNLDYKLKAIDSFLSKDDFIKLCNLKIDIDIKNDFQVYHNEVNNNGVIKSVLDEDALIIQNYFFN